METEINKVSQTNFKILKSFKEKNKINPIKLYSSMSNIYFNNKKQLNLIPLSHLFSKEFDKNIPTNDINNPDLVKNTKINSIGRNTKIQLNEFDSLYRNNSLSHRRIPFIKSKLKLPYIKSYNDKEELKGGLRGFVSTIFNKLEEFDNKFKEQGKLSENFIKKGDKDLKLKKQFFNEQNYKYKYIISKNDYKRQFSKLFKRIKNIQTI